MKKLEYGTPEWDEEYKQLIENDDLLKVHDFLMQTIPDDKIVYKYYRGNNRDYETISKPALWLCNAFHLNDPFDCSFSLKVEIDTSSQESISAGIREQMKQEIKSLNLQNRVLLASFSERSDSVLMWSHYSNDHRGVCIGYSLKEIVQRYAIFPVIYDDVLPQFDETASVLKSVLTKYSDWSYEKEWRLVNYNTTNTIINGKLIDFVKPKEIFLGYKKNHMLLRESEDKAKKTEHELLEAAEGFFIDYAYSLGLECFQYQIDAGSFGFKKVSRI